MARDFLPRQDVQVADPSGRATTPYYVWMQSLDRALGTLDVDLAAILEQIEQLKPGQKLTIEGAMSVIVTNVDGTITISLDGDNQSPGGNWYYGTNTDGVRGFWPIADGVSGGYSITKAVDYGPYDFQGELDTPDELPYPVVVDDAYLINGDLWVGADDGGDDGPGWDNLGPAPTTAVLSLINDEATPDPTHYYGTDAAGDKGWHPVSDAVEAAADELTKDVDGDGVTTFGLADVTPTPGGTLQRYGFDAKGRRSEEEAADTDDLAEGSANLYYTDGRADARIALQKAQPLGLATLDADAKLEANQLPALAITDTFVVNTEAAMLALDAQQGDVAVRTDEQKSYILTADPASELANWQELLTPTGTGGTVTSVGLSVPTGLAVSGSPITSSGTITVSYDTGYQGYTSTEASKLSGIASGATVGADWSANLSNIPASIAAWQAMPPSGRVTIADTISFASGGAINYIQSGQSGGGSGTWDELRIGPYLSSAWHLRITSAGVAEFNVRPVFNGNTPWDSANFNPATKANDADVVKLTGAQTVAGIKTLTDRLTVNANLAGVMSFTSGSGINYVQAGADTTVGSWQEMRFSPYGSGAYYLRITSSGEVQTAGGNRVWDAGNLADSGWTAPSLGTNWSGTNHGYKRFGFHVALRGQITNTAGTRSAGTTIFTLPSGYRPSADMLFVAHYVPSGGGLVNIRIGIPTSGAVTLADDLPGGATLYMSGIAFYNN